MHRSAGIVVAIMLIVACGHSPAASKASAVAAVTVPAPSPSALPFPSPSLGGSTVPAPLDITCTSQVPAGHQVALVNLHGIQGFVVRDVTDIQQPVTRCSKSTSFGFGIRFVSLTRISYLANLGDTQALYLFDLSTGTTSLIHLWHTIGAGGSPYAWSPDGQKLTYLSSETTDVRWHLLSAAGDKTLASFGIAAARDWSFDNDVVMVGFSADGQYVAVEDTYTAQTGTPTIQVVRVSDGKTVYTVTDGTMATWRAIGARLYFRTTAGVQMWEATGKVVTVLAGTQWIDPWPSSDGNHIAFTSLNPLGNHLVSILDTNSDSVTQPSSEPRAKPAFLKANLVWYVGEVPCTSTTCRLGDPPPRTSTTYIYDLAGAESPSIDQLFFDSWPHVAGQS
jgi:WD40-like Beta Propeller Repeat